ncbi:ATP-binding protein, partial [Acinetobacter baumannii]|nr:ATP-binding protein [Acinetobacter baumannii]
DIADDAVALCDANRLEQVLVNLIGNALDALDGTAGPRLDIAARRDGDRVTVTVRDNGPGLAEDVQSHLFEPF